MLFLILGAENQGRKNKSFCGLAFCAFLTGSIWKRAFLFARMYPDSGGQTARGVCKMLILLSGGDGYARGTDCRSAQGNTAT